MQEIFSAGNAAGRTAGITGRAAFHDGKQQGDAVNRQGRTAGETIHLAGKGQDHDTAIR